MSDFDSINNFLVDIWSRINKIEERALTAGIGDNISLTEIHIIEKIAAEQPSRMSTIAKSVGVTLATFTVACDKLESKGLIQRTRDTRRSHPCVPQGVPRAHDLGRTERAVGQRNRAFGEQSAKAAILL